MSNNATSSGMPQIGAAFAGWATKITLLKHVEKVVDGIVIANDIPISFSGTLQPLSARAIALKPEGQRSWTWLQIHCFARAVNLIPGDQVVWNGDIYKVTEIKDYRLSGYIEYHLAKDFQQGGTP
jgi:hypothetical protein